MDIQNIFNIIIGASLAVGGWFARQLWDAINKLRADHEDHRVKIASEYLSKLDFKGAIDNLSRDMRDNFERLFNRLDGKADK